MMQNLSIDSVAGVGEASVQKRTASEVSLLHPRNIFCTL